MKLNTPSLSPDEFVARWRSATLSERASYQQHFADVCRLVGARTPIEEDQTGENYTYEYGLKKTNGKQGFADVFYRGYFAIEYKQQGKYKDLSEAYSQLLQYRENLNNPPLLIVCDIERWEIHTNFTNAPTVIHTFTNEDLLKPTTRGILRRIFADPGSFHPDTNKLQITEDVAATFKDVVDGVIELKNAPDRVARFMTKLVFGMFVEDIGLLPKRAYDGILTEIIRMTRYHHDSRNLFVRYIRELFDAMATGGSVQLLDIPWFNGSMFEVDDDDIFPLGGNALHALDRATDRNWAHVEPTIFGTIFERTLDEKKRGQLGAHYTHPDDIRLIVEPVLMQPLRREWEALQAEAAPARERYVNAGHAAARMAAERELLALRGQILDRVRSITVLDPACGSGNFLYISLRLLLDLEKEIITHPLWAGLSRETIGVHPHQLYGMEVNEIAHALASVVVWIGYLQWRYDNGYFETAKPILSRMSENIRHMDAILAYDADGKPVEPEWQPVDVIVGNPPFLGGYKQRGELGSKYLDDVWSVYADRVPPTADLVCYWFERARTELEHKNVKRAGLLSTNSIRGGSNREVLKRIKESGDIFWAWGDRPWILDGAAVRVSMVGFDDASETNRELDGRNVSAINPDLTSAIDITGAKRLTENRDICLRGEEKHGAFDITEAQAKTMLAAKNKSKRSNSDVVRRYINGIDVLRGQRNVWIIDFDEMELKEAELYELPMAHVREHVKPERDKNNRARRRELWWQHGEVIPNMRRAIAPLARYIVTPRVAKHRIFLWLEHGIIPDSSLVPVAREDDYFFGVLHSQLHELWSLRMGTWLGKGNDPRYTPTTTFETFPFPFIPGKEDFSDPRVVAVSAAAKALHEERHAWLNPPPLTPRLNERTLTNLYNALQYHRGLAPAKGIKADAATFAPRLHELHTALDLAVVAAYGWDVTILDDEEAILRHLLDLNAARAGVTPSNQQDSDQAE